MAGNAHALRGSRSSHLSHPRRAAAFLAVAVMTIAAVTSIVSGAPPARASATEVLILGSTVSGGISSAEALEVVAKGYTPVIVDDPTWQGMSTSQFASYKALVIGDPTCSQTAPAAAISTATTWGPAVSGNTLVIGTDPVYHSKTQFVTQGIDFVLAGKVGTTGAYLDLSCNYDNQPTTTDASMLDGLRGAGAFTVHTASCYNTVHIVATHPALAGLSDAYMSGWSCSVHEVFDTWPGDFQVLAIAQDLNSTYTASDGTVGAPYILASGSGLHSFPLSLSPLSQTAAIGSSSSVTAQLLDGTTSLPVAGRALSFRVESGPNAGKPGVCSNAGCLTDSSGQVSWTYKGSAIGTDTVQVWLDLNNDGQPSIGEPQTTAAASWTIPTPTGKYVALGDSYSAGEGVPKFIVGTNIPANRCHRSVHAYSQLVAGSPGFPPVTEFWACSNAVISNFYLNKGQWNETAGQLSHLDSSTTLVSLSVGGNDVQFVPILIGCLAIVNCQNTFGLAEDLLINHTAPRLSQLYTNILAKAPHAQIYILGYPRIISTSPSLLCRAAGIQSAEAQWIDAKVTQLDRVIQNAINNIGNRRLHYVDTLNLFAGGEACSVTGVDMNAFVPLHPEYSFHPTAAGQALFASALAHAVRRH